jgi:3-methyl-2-oxobutanoate hydroxymethyltransferase
MSDRTPVTVLDVRARKGTEKLVMVTAYDTPTASIADAAGVDLILVGDSVANVVLGHENTQAVDVDVMVHHAAAVTRAHPSALVVADMPWMSFHVSEEDTVRNASRLVREGGVTAVKLEGGVKRLPMIRAILDAEIPVMGHLGLTPQSVLSMGYRVQGRQADQARLLVEEARVLDEAGVFAIVLEGVPDVVATAVTEAVSCPTIGIGAGAGCDGQVLVFHDALGLHDGHYPKFARRFADLRSLAVGALADYAAEVRSGAFPAEAETYHMSDEERVAFESREAPRADFVPSSWA